MKIHGGEGVGGSRFSRSPAGRRVHHCCLAAQARMKFQQRRHQKPGRGNAVQAETQAPMPVQEAGHSAVDSFSIAPCRSHVTRD
jgi:hypothetical protein